MASVLNTPSATVNGASSSQTIAHTTDADTDVLAVCVVNSHGTTISSITFDGVALTQRVTAQDTTANSRAHIWSLNSPGAKTANVVITYGGNTNCAAAIVNIGAASGNILDTGSRVQTTNGQPTSLTLDPTATGALCLSAIIGGGASLSFASSGGTEHVDAAGATGRFGVGSVVADAVTEVMDWGTMPGATSAHVAVAWETEAGGGGGGGFRSRIAGGFVLT